MLGGRWRAFRGGAGALGEGGVKPGCGMSFGVNLEACLELAGGVAAVIMLGRKFQIDLGQLAFDCLVLDPQIG